jgi:predicted Zn-dependent protease
MYRYGARTWWALGVLVLAGLVLPACSKNVTTGRNQLNLMSREDEIRLGTQAKPQLTQEFGGEVQKPEVRQYVTEIGRTLAAQTEGENPSLPWEFTMLDSKVINAFALPGGKVFISRGLVEKMTNEAQLAGVLGHEIGHVTARHSTERMSQQMGWGIGGAVVGAVVGAVTGVQGIDRVAQNASQLVVLSYSRDQESEADSLGMRYMTKVGYDPMGTLQVMDILKEASKGGGKGPEWMATHPLPETRIRRVGDEIQREYGFTQNNPQFQLHAPRFRERMLARLALLPAHTHDPLRDAPETALAGGEFFARPELWCWHCAMAK